MIVPTQAIINHAASMDLCTHLKVQRFTRTRRRRASVNLGMVQFSTAHANLHLGALCCFMFLTGASCKSRL